jgi:amidase
MEVGHSLAARKSFDGGGSLVLRNTANCRKKMSSIPVTLRRGCNHMKKRRFDVVQWVLVGLLITSYLDGCSILPRRSPTGSRDHAYIDYWPAAAKGGGLKLAVKDNIDMQGVVTSAGSENLFKTGVPASRDADCLSIARERNLPIVGKTTLSEFAISPSGLNDYFGTPRNPFNKRRKFIPGGSSSGSAVAVADGSADIAFGTDSAGSIRLPAACCGVVGLKTTFGLISTKGIYPIDSKRLDTVGPMAKDVARVVEGMDLLQRGFGEKYRKAVAAKPEAKKIRIGRLYLSGTDPKVDKAVDQALAEGQFRVIPLDQRFKNSWEQAKRDGNTLAAVGAWITDQKYLYKTGVLVRTKSVIALGSVLYTTQYRQALQRQAQWQRVLRQIFRKIDFIALPTLQTLPPTIPPIGKIALLEARVLDLQNTTAVNFAGNPALAIPIPVNDRSVPVTSLQLVGRRLSEADLLNAGRLIESENPHLLLQIQSRKKQVPARIKPG